MININFYKEKFISFANQHKYALLIFVFIAIVIVNLIISSLFGTQSDQPVIPDEEGTPSEIVTYENLDSSRKSMVEDSIESFQDNRLFSNVSINESFGEEELTAVNEASYIYYYTNLGPNAIKDLFNASTISIVGGSNYRLEGISSLSRFTSGYRQEISRNLNAFVRLNLVEQREVAQGEFHFEEFVQDDERTHILRIYHVYINNGLLVQNNSTEPVSIIAYENLNTHEVRVDIPVFLPSEATAAARKNYTESTYNLSPSVPLDLEFSSVILDRLSETDFNVTHGTAQLLYVFDNEEGVLYSLLSKEAVLTGEQFEDLDNKKYLMTNFNLE